MKLNCPRCSSAKSYRRKRENWFKCVGCGKEFSRKSFSGLKDIRVSEERIKHIVRKMCEPGKTATIKEVMEAGNLGSNNTAKTLMTLIRQAMSRLSQSDESIFGARNRIVLHDFRNQRILCVVAKEIKNSKHCELSFILSDNQKLFSGTSYEIDTLNFKLNLKGGFPSAYLKEFKEYIKRKKRQLSSSHEPEMVCVQYFFNMAIGEKQANREKRVWKELVKASI